MTFLTMKELNLHQKRLLIRADLNVPINEGKILSDQRLTAILPTLKLALAQKACVLLISHLGRPKEGIFDPNYSLKPIAERLSQLLSHPVHFDPNWLETKKCEPGTIVLGENVRFNKGEKDNDPTLAKKMASLCDIFIMDAFATAHRAEASTYGVAEYAETAASGLLLTQELNALNKIFAHPKHPIVAIVGGAKMSSKLLILKSLLAKVDTLILGGGIANTFIHALGYSVGHSLYEPEFVEDAKQLLKEAKRQNKTILLPIDVVVSENITKAENMSTKKISDLEPSEMIVDVGPLSIQKYKEYIEEANTILWNGPLGVFELAPFSEGTKALANIIANAKAFSIAGGGETLAAIEKYQVADKLSYISTGGGAFLEYLEGKTLPAIEALENAWEKNVTKSTTSE